MDKDVSHREAQHQGAQSIPRELLCHSHRAQQWRMSWTTITSSDKCRESHGCCSLLPSLISSVPSFQKAETKTGHSIPDHSDHQLSQKRNSFLTSLFNTLICSDMLQHCLSNDSGAFQAGISSLLLPESSMVWHTLFAALSAYAVCTFYLCLFPRTQLIGLHTLAGMPHTHFRCHSCQVG